MNKQQTWEALKLPSQRDCDNCANNVDGICKDENNSVHGYNAKQADIQFCAGYHDYQARKRPDIEEKMERPDYNGWKWNEIDK